MEPKSGPFKEVQESIELSASDAVEESSTIDNVTNSALTAAYDPGADEKVSAHLTAAPEPNLALHADQPWKRRRNQKNNLVLDGFPSNLVLPNMPRRLAAFIIDCGVFSVFGAAASFLFTYVLSLTLYPLVNAHAAAGAPLAKFVFPNVSEILGAVTACFIGPIIMPAWLLLAITNVGTEFHFMYAAHWPFWLQTLAFIALTGLFLAGPLGWALYNCLFESSAWQATPGKKLLRLKIVSQTGSRLTFRQALKRICLKAVTQLGILCAPLLLILLVFFPHIRAQLTIYRTTRRLWHDQIAKTQIVTVSGQQPEHTHLY